MFDFSTRARRKEAWLFLDTVWQGLEYLYLQVERAEKERAQSLGSTDETAKNFSYCDVGSSPGDSMVCNYFVWYANALSNFIGVFKKAFRPRENLKKEFRSVITWRNKVAAHTSWVWPKGDSAETRNASILLFPEFSAGHFEIGGFRFFRPRTESMVARVKKFLRKLLRIQVRDHPVWHWGLVRTHERLKEIVSKYASAN
jgi:hypothetical protein